MRSGRAAVIVSSSIVLLLVAAALCAPLLASHDPLTIPRGQALLKPSSDHWFGTDQLGRDIFARVLYGARSSLVVGIAAAALAGVVGTAVGVVAGFLGGKVDLILMRVVEVVLVLPSLLLAGALITVWGRGKPTLIVVLALVGWPLIARVARASVFEVRGAAFVDAARVMGSSRRSVLWHHVLPHALPPVIVIGVISVGSAILGESALAFLAVGVTEPTPSWGLMISAGSDYLGTAPGVVLFPGAAVFVTVLSFVMLGEGLRALFRLDAQ